MRPIGLAAVFIAGAVMPRLAQTAAGRLQTPADKTAPAIVRPASPLKISRRGWVRALVAAGKRFMANRIPSAAASATFYALLAVFPALAAFVSLFGLVANVEQARRQIAALAGVMPAGALSVLDDQMGRLGATSHGSLSLALAGSLLISITSANAGAKALLAGLNTAYDEEERRGFIKLNLVSLAFTAGGVLLSTAALTAVVDAPALWRKLGLPVVPGLALLRWPLLLVVVAGLLSLLYLYGPSRRPPQWIWSAPGALAASLGWIAMSVAFTWYVANFGHYNRTYGSLGAVIGFMTWIWMSLIVVLFGAELNASLELRTPA